MELDWKEVKKEMSLERGLLCWSRGVQMKCHGKPFCFIWLKRKAGISLFLIQNKKVKEIETRETKKLASWEEFCIFCSEGNRKKRGVSGMKRFKSCWSRLDAWISSGMLLRKEGTHFVKFYRREFSCKRHNKQNRALRRLWSWIWDSKACSGESHPHEKKKVIIPGLS